MNHDRLFLVLTLAFAASGCKSKLEKCNQACDEIRAEREASCPADGDERDACLQTTRETAAACSELCQQAVGEAAPRSSERAEQDDSPNERRASACEAGRARACMELAADHLAGRGVEKSDRRAAELLERACELGDPLGCEMFGKMLREGRGVDADAGRASRLFGKACDGGAAGACTSLGLEAMQRGDKTRGAALLEKACNGDDRLGCMALGGLHLHGNGVPKDPVRARALLEKACRLGQQDACDKVREIGG